MNRAEKRKSSSGRERNSHWRAGRRSPIARFAGAAGNPRGRGRSGRLRWRRRRRRDQAGERADSRSDGWTPTCSLWLGCAGAVDTEEDGGDAVCLVPLPAPAGCGGRREGHRAAPAWWDPLWPSFAVAAMHHRIHPSTFLRYSSFTWSHSIHMVITCYYS